jgi:hypothetical protein
MFFHGRLYSRIFSEWDNSSGNMDNFCHALKQRMAIPAPICTKLAVSGGSAWRSVPNFVKVRTEIYKMQVKLH